MNIDQFTNYYEKKMKQNLTKRQKLREIEKYFYRRTLDEQSFENERECFYYISSYIAEHENEAEEVLQELYFLLEYSFGTNNPNYLYEFLIEADCEEFETLVSSMVSKEFDYGEFKYRLLSKNFDAVNQVIEYEFEFTEFATFDITNEVYRKYTGIINVTFDFINKKFITSKSPIPKNHNNIFEFFKEFSGATINPYYILKRKSFLSKKNTTEFSITTLLIINLLYETIPSMGYNFTLDSISFSNLDSVNIQRVKMSGTDLLKAPEVLQRVHSFDDVQNLKITITIVKRENGIDVFSYLTFTLDIQGKLCFIFTDDTVLNSNTREICYKIQESLMDLLYDTSTIQSGSQLIHSELPAPKSQQQIVSQIFADVLDLTSNIDDKIAIERYFIDNFPLIIKSVEA